MRSTSDVQLLRAYADDGSEAAFAELVRRHADLVYSAALRQVDSPDLAHDVTQAVFTDLSRKAAPLAVSLPEEATLIGWLHRGARFEALSLRRGEHRRRQRELHAMAHLDDTSDPPVDWDALRPCLDEALDELEPADRDALLLRYFENRDLRTVGAALGVSDDAAQKRVARAVDKLRSLLARRGVKTSAAGLAAVISAQAVQAAPAALTTVLLSLSTAGVATTATSATAVATLAMTTTQKLLVATVLAAAVGTGVYEAREAAQLRRDLASLRQEHQPLAARLAELEADRARLSNLVASLNAENDQLQARSTDALKAHKQALQLADKTQREVAGADPDVQEALKWKAKKEKLQRLFNERPDQSIPELELLGEDESIWWERARWLDLDSDDGIRAAKSLLRNEAANRFALQLDAAVRHHAKLHSGQFPESLNQIANLLQPPADPSWLSRYAIRKADEEKYLGGSLLSFAPRPSTMSST